MGAHLAKVAHLPIIRKGTEHAHSRQAHPKHIITSECTICISVSIDLLLLLLLLLLSKSSSRIGTELCHAISIRRVVDVKRRGGVERVAIETSRGRGIIKRRLRNAGLWTITIVCKGIAGCSCISGRQAIWGVNRSGRPSSLFGIRTTDGIHRALGTSIR
jgi:hypothetical protein